MHYDNRNALLAILLGACRQSGGQIVSKISGIRLNFGWCTRYMPATCDTNINTIKSDPYPAFIHDHMDIHGYIRSMKTSCHQLRSPTDHHAGTTGRASSGENENLSLHILRCEGIQKLSRCWFGIGSIVFLFRWLFRRVQRSVLCVLLHSRTRCWYSRPTLYMYYPRPTYRVVCTVRVSGLECDVKVRWSEVRQFRAVAEATMLKLLITCWVPVMSLFSAVSIRSAYLFWITVNCWMLVPSRGRKQCQLHHQHQLCTAWSSRTPLYFLTVLFDFSDAVKTAKRTTDASFTEINAAVGKWLVGSTR